MGLFDIVNPAGGLQYHWKALRFRKTLWLPYVQAVSEWLSTWAPAERELIIVGPSFGYTLPRKWLSRFKQIYLLDPDPLVRFAYRSVGRNTQVTQFTTPIFPFPDPWGEFLQKHPNAALLFANFLGQIPYLFENATEIFQSGILDLPNRSVASLHDRVSFSFIPNRELWKPMWMSERLTTEKILETLGVSPKFPTFVDHLTEGLFPSIKEATFFSWSLTPWQHHVIEGVRTP